jgi:hypothetical protein
MQLPPEQTERFYRIWVALLHYVNEQQHLVPAFPPAKKGMGFFRSPTRCRSATRCGPMRGCANASLPPILQASHQPIWPW